MSVIISFQKVKWDNIINIKYYFNVLSVLIRLRHLHPSSLSEGRSLTRYVDGLPLIPPPQAWDLTHQIHVFTVFSLPGPCHCIHNSALLILGESVCLFLYCIQLMGLFHQNHITAILQKLSKKCSIPYRRQFMIIIISILLFQYYLYSV